MAPIPPRAGCGISCGLLYCQKICELSSHPLTGKVQRMCACKRNKMYTPPYADFGMWGGVYVVYTYKSSDDCLGSFDNPVITERRV